MRVYATVIRALVVRAVHEITRVPGAAIPAVIAPTIFMIGLSGLFGKAASLPGFHVDSFRTFIVPVGMLQGAAFTGAATGVNLARDIEQGWFDRLLVCPAPRLAILLGMVASAALRALMPATFLLTVAFALGVHWPGVPALALGVLLMMGTATTIAFYAVIVALRFRTQQAAALMQAGGFVATLFTAAYAPKALLAPWMRDIATVNPMTLVLDGVRQGFVGGMTWSHTWPALVALAGLLAVLGTLANWRLARLDV